jgi:hypothetical protein
VGAPYVTEEEPDRSRGLSTAGSACYATPSTFTTRLRLHRRPAVSAVAFSLLPAPSPCLVSVCGRAFEPPVAERVAPPSPHGRRRVASCRRKPGAVATPSRVDPVLSPSLGPGKFAGRAEGYPAPRRRALRRTLVAPLARCAGTSFPPRRVSG